MNPRTFLRTTLAAPVVVPLLALASESVSGFAFVLIMSLAFGAIPYLITAAILWVHIGRCGSQRSAIRLILLAPLIFASLQALTWLVWVWLNPSEPSGVTVAAALAAYGLLIGYGYSAVVALLLVGGFRAGLLSAFTTTSHATVEANAA